MNETQTIQRIFKHCHFHFCQTYYSDKNISWLSVLSDKYKLQGNFHELPHWIFQLLSKQCASELNLLAQNSCSSGVHNNVNFEQHGEAKISHECDPCVFKVLKEYSVICWPCCLQLIFGTYTMVTCLRASTKVCNLCSRHLSQNFSKSDSGHTALEGPLG